MSTNACHCPQCHPRDDDSIYSLSSFLGQVDPWYDSNVNGLQTSINKLCEMVTAQCSMSSMPRWASAPANQLFWFRASNAIAFHCNYWYMFDIVFYEVIICTLIQPFSIHQFITEPHRHAHASDLWPSYCEAAVLTFAPQCHPKKMHLL